MVTYEEIKLSFEKRKCNLLTSEKEYIEMCTNKIKFKKFNYIASCNHNHVVFYNVFISRNTGVVCPSCKNKNNGLISKEKRKNNKIELLEQEYKCIQYFMELTCETFNVMKAFDGCNSDIIFKPNHNLSNEWVGIQVKSNFKLNRTYCFSILNDYKDCLLFLMCMENKKMWLIPSNIIKNQQKLSIGVNKSKYSIYEVSPENINDKLFELYNKNFKNTFENLNIPKCIYQSREKEFRYFREKLLNYIPFENNDMEGLVYDFKIGNKKIQEKIGGCDKSDPRRFIFSLCKNNGKRKQIQYDISDNNIYWLNCADKKYFFVIPEKILIDRNYIGNKYSKKVLKINPINVSKNNLWLKPYIFCYENIDKEELLQILEL
jgi:hypothetical protein